MGDDYQVVRHTEVFGGRVFDVVSDEVRMPGGGSAVRDWIRHPGAVGVAAVDLAAGARAEILLIRQYRHPVGRELWELPAGLLDVPDEAPVAAARRELAEEADLHAEQWDTLVDLLTSPGSSDEAIRLFLARGVTPVAEAERHQRTDEEATLSAAWIDLDQALEWVFEGAIENAACVAGVLATARVRDAGWRGLRPPDASWPARRRSQP